MKNTIRKDFDMEQELLKRVYQKTLGYELESIIVNQDGSTTHLHSDKFLDEHPERSDTPEFTDNEEREQVELISTLAKSKM